MTETEATYFFLAARRFSKISGKRPLITVFFMNKLPEGVLIYWSGVSLYNKSPKLETD